MHHTKILILTISRPRDVGAFPYLWRQIPIGGNSSYNNLGKRIVSNPPNCPTPFDVFWNFTKQESISQTLFWKKWPRTQLYPDGLCVFSYSFVKLRGIGIGADAGSLAGICWIVNGSWNLVYSLFPTFLSERVMVKTWTHMWRVLPNHPN